TESGEEAAAKEEAPAGAGGEGQEAPKAPQKSKYNEEQIALLKQIKSYMVQSWAAKTKLIKHIEPTKLNGKYYVASQRKFAPQKKAIIKQIGGSEIPSLKNVKSFLKKSSNNDIRLEAKELPFMEKVQEIKSILETELPVQEDLINQLKKDIGEEEEPAAGKSSE
ncbi:MAG: hypothetical protein OEZ51_15140, partial [Nitrospinota bacterium]|nr:hypothetical protein [Nitrospinota bacterium]